MKNSNLSAFGVLTIIVFLFLFAGIYCADGEKVVQSPDGACVDTDDDGVCDEDDNCVNDANADQKDIDNDGDGDVCDEDMDGDGVSNADDNCPWYENDDQDDADEDGFGEACDPCPGDATNDCFELKTASIFAVPDGESATYIGDHPRYPGTEHVQTYEFNSDGSVTKWWNPDPVGSPTLPGDLTCVGTWSVDGAGLTVSTIASVMGMDMVSVETYDVAFTYEDGLYLDFFSAKKSAPADGTTMEGTYTLHTEVTVVLGAMMDSLIISDTTTTVDSANNWSSAETTTSTCTGDACSEDMNGTKTTNTNGFIGNWLFDLDGSYIIQTDDIFVLERQ